MKLYSGQMNFVTGNVSWVFLAVLLISIYCVLSQSPIDDIQRILLPPTRKGPIKIDSKFPNSHEGKICDILKWNYKATRYDPLLPCRDGQDCQEKDASKGVCTLWTQLENIDKIIGNKYGYVSDIPGETYYFTVEIGVYVSPSRTGRIEIGSMYPESNEEKICFIINLNKGNDPLPICSDGIEEDCQEKDASKSVCTLWTQLENIDKLIGNKYSYSITGETYYFHVEIGDGNECKSYPCVHGTCYSAYLWNDYQCICYPGYIGANCENEIDECDLSPCVHGTCTDFINGYQCTCSPGYTGSKCEIENDECDPSPCVHGNCTDLINGYNCTCSPGFTGANCSEDIDECSSSPCVHGACTDRINGYHCICSPGYTGSNCEKGEANKVWILGIALIVIILFVGGCVSIYIYRRKKQEERRKKKAARHNDSSDGVCYEKVYRAGGEKDFPDGGREEDDGGFGDDSSDYGHLTRAVRRKRGKKR